MEVPVAALALAAALYFLLRFLFAVPFWPTADATTPPLLPSIVLALVLPTPLLLLAPRTPTTLCALLALLAAATAALRFTRDAPPRAPPPQALFWRLDVALFALAALALSAAADWCVPAARVYAAAVALFAVAGPFVRALAARADPSSRNGWLGRLGAALRTAVRVAPRRAGAVHTVPPAADDVSAFDLLSFDWATPLVSAGRDRPLEADDVHSMPPQFSARRSADDRLAPRWMAEIAGRARPSLARALCSAFGARLAVAGLLKLVNDATLFVPPVLLRWITQFLQARRAGDGPVSPTSGLLMAVVLLTAYIGQSLCFNHYFNVNCTVQALVRGSLVSMLYQKSCRLSPESRGAYTTGQIQNLMSNDTRSVADAVLYIHMLWSSVLQVSVAMALLVNMLGWVPTLAGVACILATMPLQARLVGITRALRERASGQTDERVKAVSEAVRGMKLVKLYAWELSFVRRILALRGKELSLIRSMTLVSACSSLVASALPTLLTLTVFVAFVLAGKVLDASIVFPAIALFAVIRPGLLIFPMMLVNVARAAASLSRLRGFMLAEELQPLDDGPHRIDQDALARDGLDAAIDRASFAWDPSTAARPTLADISLRVPAGALVALVGPTGCGKSTLLASLLGEVPILSGHAGLRKGRSVAFCDQVPFVQNATVKENILFGRPVNDAAYAQTIDACCLEPDLDILPAGDNTEIGGRGVNLSGGQRARVSLARAAYSGADIVLLDDPLSAVDAHVGKKLFNECIVKKMHGSTRLLSTNQIHFAASAAVDMIVVVRDGSVVECGTRGDLLADPSSKFSQLLESAGELGAGVEASEAESAEQPQDEMNGHVEANGTSDAIEPSKTASADQAVGEKTSLKLKNADSYGSLEAGKLTQKERKSVGRVKWKHYNAYLTAMGIWQFVLPMLATAFVTQVFFMAVNVWLSLWSDASLADGGDTMTVTGRLTVFLLLGLFSVLFTGVTGLLLALGAIRASMLTHEKFLLSVFGAPSSFFNSTPQGRLVNRFNSDTDKVDSQVGGNIQSMGRLVLSLSFSVAINVWAAPALVFLIIPIAALCIFIQEYYRKTSVDLYRLESLARSPLYSHFSETLDGVMTIRAYGDVERGSHISDVHTDALVKATYATSVARRWLSIRLEAMGTVIVFGATISAVLSPADGLSASMLSLVLSYTMQMLGIMTWCVRQFTELESNMNAMERIVEYSEPPFPQEERGGLDGFLKTQQDQTPGTQLDARASRGVISREKLEQLNNRVHRKAARWPSRGHISFENVEMRYKADLQPALRDLSFTARPGEHVGIVGRTGAGKSSAIQSLFRLYEPCKGRIMIDGVDISTMRLFDLRSAIGVIPQEAVCFSGTIRSNLDMFGENEDSAVQRALDLCGLQDTMRERVGLDFEVAENGSNLSVGQRQLLCLGRALLKGSQLLVLDEATSSVSNEADEKIQQTLREEMSQCTILTVAHRLHTVIQSDRIIVMDKGRIAEMGAPAELLDRPSMLGDLVDETGPSTAAYLRKLANTPRPRAGVMGANGVVESVGDGKRDVGANNFVQNGHVMSAAAASGSEESRREAVRAALSDLRAVLQEMPATAGGDEDGEAGSVEASLRKVIGRLEVVSEDAGRSGEYEGMGEVIASKQ